MISQRLEDLMIRPAIVALVAILTAILLAKGLP